MKLLDTCFLIDLQREIAKGEIGATQDFLAEQPDEEEFAISVISMLEFLEGFSETRVGEEFLEPFDKVTVGENVSRIGSRLRRSLRRQGQMIGDFDLLIAATALDIDAELVTDNTNHFGRIPELRLVGYRE